MNEAYVSFNTAKLLKEKEFDWGCCSYWCIFPNGDRVHTDYGHFANHNGNETDRFVSCPTQAVACRWLREEHNIHITTEPLEMFKQERIVYEPIIYLLNDFDDFALEYKTVHLKECDTNENAVEAALEYALKNLI